MEILLGCDPEVFTKKNNIFHSAFGLIKGDKKNPYPVNNGAVQVDGMALEFNINPASSEKEFIYNVQDVLSTLRAMVPEYEVVISPVADFSPEHMAIQPQEALELGCDPDYNAWSLDANPKPQGDRPFRTASGHIHIGWTSADQVEGNEGGHFNSCAKMGRQMDFFLGLPSLFYDNDVRRREMYGCAGAIRAKPYGVEYRTLSNMWLSSPELMGWVYRNAIAGAKSLMGGNDLSLKYGNIEHIINTSNQKEALKIIKAEGIEVPNV
jgi:hypothetical protein